MKRLCARFIVAEEAVISCEIASERSVGENNIITSLFLEMQRNNTGTVRNENIIAQDREG